MLKIIFKISLCLVFQFMTLIIATTIASARTNTTATPANSDISAAVVGADTPQRVASFNNWAVYKYRAQGRNICYALSSPLQALPVKAHHGATYFLISQRRGPNNEPEFEPQFLAGYNLKEGSHVTLHVALKTKKAGSAGKSGAGKSGKEQMKAQMYVRGKAAWLKSAIDEQRFVTQMKKSGNLQLDALSARGTKTSYSFSLLGLTKALAATMKCN